MPFEFLPGRSILIKWENRGKFVISAKSNSLTPSWPAFWLIDVTATSCFKMPFSWHQHKIFLNKSCDLWSTMNVTGFSKAWTAFAILIAPVIPSFSSIGSQSTRQGNPVTIATDFASCDTLRADNNRSSGTWILSTPLFPKSSLMAVSIFEIWLFAFVLISEYTWDCSCKQITFGSG